MKGRENQFDDNDMTHKLEEKNSSWTSGVVVSTISKRVYLPWKNELVNYGQFRVPSRDHDTDIIHQECHNPGPQLAYCKNSGTGVKPVLRTKSIVDIPKLRFHSKIGLRTSSGNVKATRRSTTSEIRSLAKCLKKLWLLNLTFLWMIRLTMRALFTLNQRKSQQPTRRHFKNQ